MKTKIIVLIACLGFASSAFAVTTLTSATVIGGGTFSPSAKVTIKVLADAQAYSAAAQHVNGKKQFATVSSDPKIYFSDAVASGPTDPGSTTTKGNVTWSTY